MITKIKNWPEIFGVDYGQLWVWQVWSQDSKMSRWNEVIFFHAGTKAKVDSTIFGWALPKMAMTF